MAQLPPEQDESLIDMATRYGQGVMRKHPIITRGLVSAATDPLDLMQFLAMHGVEPGIVAPNQIETPEQVAARQERASSIPNAGELAQKYLAQAGVRESETLPEQLGEMGISMLGPAMLAKAPKAFSWGKRILGKMDLPKATALKKASGGAVHMGKGGLLKAGAEELTELAAKYLPKQKISSAETSLKQVPALFRKIEAVPGQRNLDIGGGKYDLGKDYLSGRGVESHVYDPFNRTPEHNAVVLDQFKQSPADSITVANVLNVIKEPKSRKDTINMAYEYLKPGGKAYFDIYEGSRSGVGKVTSKGWQNNAPATKYEQELKSVFGDNLVRKGTTFIGEKPVADVVEAPAIGLDLNKNKIESFGKDFNQLITEGTDQEYSGISKLIEDWNYNGNHKALLKAESHYEYPQYKETINQILKSAYPEGKIPVYRASGLHGTGNKNKYVSTSVLPQYGASKGGKSYFISPEDVYAVGNLEEGELIVNSSVLNLANMKKASGGLSRVNEAGNYTKPGMRKQLFNSIKARAVQGTGAGQWSARKAQLLAKSYKEKGVGYKD